MTRYCPVCDSGDAIEVAAYRNADKAFPTASVSVGGGVQLNNTYQKS